MILPNLPYALILLLLSAMPSRAADAGTGCRGFAGRWETPLGIMAIVLDGERVTGSLFGGAAALTGRISDGVLEASWGDAKKGRLKVELSADGRALKGGYSIGDWNMELGLNGTCLGAAESGSRPAATPAPRPRVGIAAYGKDESDGSDVGWNAPYPDPSFDDDPNRRGLPNAVWHGGYHWEGSELCLDVAELSAPYPPAHTLAVGYTVTLEGGSFKNGSNRKTVIVHRFSGTPEPGVKTLCVATRAPESAAGSQAAGDPVGESPGEAPGMAPEGAETAATGPPPGLGAAAPLKITRWTTFRRITNFPRGEGAKFINAAKISADGSKIAFSAYNGTYVINPDGTGLTRLSDKRNEGRVDISADGRRVVWYEEHNRAGYVGDSGALGKTRLSGGFYVQAVRITAKGDRVFVVSGEGGGIFAVPVDGSEGKKIVTTANVCKLNGVDENGNHWRDILDISDNGSNIVFHLLMDAFAAHGDGSGLRQLTQNRPSQDFSLKSVRVSGNGGKIAILHERGEKTAAALMDWGGGNRVEYLGWDYGYGDWMQLSRDGKQAALSWGLRLLDSRGNSSWNALDFGRDLIYRPAMASLTADFKRACLVIEGGESTDQGRPSQLVIVDFNPARLGPAPAITDISVSPGDVPNDGSKPVTPSARVTGEDITAVVVQMIRDGWNLHGISYTSQLLWDDGSNGDPSAKDGIFTNNGLALVSYGKVAPGPVALRYTAANKAGHILSVEAEGFKARGP